MTLLATKQFTVKNLPKLLQIIRDLRDLPEPTRDNTHEPNAVILLDIRDECFRHFNLPADYMAFFRMFFNFAIGKLGYDNFYRDLLSYVLGEMIRRGWQFPGHNRPSTTLWNTIPLEIKDRLLASIIGNYQILQDRLKVIDAGLGDSPEGKIHRQSRYEQFANRILADIEREVIAWR